MKKLLVLLAIVMVAGCAGHKKMLTWTPLDNRVVTEQEFRQDVYDCTLQSRNYSSGGGTGLIGLAVMADAQQKGQEQANQLFIMCMQAKGYSYTVQDKHYDLDSTGLLDDTWEKNHPNKPQGSPLTKFKPLDKVVCVDELGFVLIIDGKVQGNLLTLNKVYTVSSVDLFGNIQVEEISNKDYWFNPNIFKPYQR